METQRHSWPVAATLGAVCLGYAVVGLVAIQPATLLGWDEVVYVSQYDPRRPAAYFSAPRARGVSLLAAPIVLATGSVVALRCFLALAAALAMFAAFWPWARLLPTPWAAPLAALGYAGLWVSLFYTAAAMPNHYLAMAAVAAVGWFLVATRVPVTGRGVRPLLWLAVALALAGLTRPSDTFWLGVALLTAMAIVPAWRQTSLAVALCCGLAAGAVPWVVESYLAFGGLGQRLERASEIQGGTGLTFSLRQVASTLDGPLLCRPCVSGELHWPALLWWLALPPLAAVGVVRAGRAGRAAVGWLPLAVAASLAVTYLFLIDYSAPRFLLPTYALLFLPTALGALALVRAGRPRARPVLAVALAVGVTGHLAIQGVILWHWADTHIGIRRSYATVAAFLADKGVRPPCVLTGAEAIPIAYHAGCMSAAPAGHNATHTHAQLRALTCRRPAALLTEGEAPPQWAQDWDNYTVSDRMPGKDWRVHIPPWTPAAGDGSTPCPVTEPGS
ncbi:hypothetical protein [Salinactinospora qingdaonensis]|uniref:4-amino-4-deoxy-L-arabinose transferase n=1 Tax=Salinactinospora qingdaonensis TaxID=702744 RepID=A0ABP7GA41_9ACTN